MALVVVSNYIRSCKYDDSCYVDDETNVNCSCG